MIPYEAESTENEKGARKRQLTGFHLIGFQPILIKWVTEEQNHLFHNKNDYATFRLSRDSSPFSLSPFINFSHSL